MFFSSFSSVSLPAKRNSTRSRSSAMEKRNDRAVSARVNKGKVYLLVCARARRPRGLSAVYSVCASFVTAQELHRFPVAPPQTRHDGAWGKCWTVGPEGNHQAHVGGRWHTIRNKAGACASRRHDT